MSTRIWDPSGLDLAKPERPRQRLPKSPPPVASVGAGVLPRDFRDNVRGLTPASVLSLQRTAGNQAVAQALAVQRQDGRRVKLRNETDQTTPGSKLNILKVTVAGSGDLVWKTHKTSIDEKGWEAIKAKDKVKSYERDKISGDGTVDQELCFSGPLGLGGIKDSGSNSIRRLIKYVPERVQAAVGKIRNQNELPIHLLLRAHSRGAVAGSHIANELSKRRMTDGNGDLVKLEVVLFDPVPGPGHKKKYEKIHLDPFVEQTTVVYSVKSGYAAFFDPARVLRAKRIIITGEPHSAGIQNGFEYKGDTYTGSDLSSLDPGVYVERSSEPGVLRKADDIEAAKRRMKRTFKSVKRSGGSKERSKRIKKVLEDYFDNGQPSSTNARTNPLYKAGIMGRKNPLYRGR